MSSLNLLRLIRNSIVCLGVFTIQATVTWGAPFTPGNLVVVRVGTGAGALTSAATAGFLDEYSTSGALVQSIPLPTATNGANRRLTFSGTSTSEGGLSRSADGRYVVLAGYDAAVGTASITSSTAASINRVVARVAADGTIDTTTALADFASGGNPRSATTDDGTQFWLAGSAGGARYAAFGASSSTQLSTTVTNLRVVQIFDGQLYTSANSGAFRLATIGTGVPTTSGQTIVNLPGFPTSGGSPYGYFFADLNPGIAGLDTVYVADDSGGAGIQKYSLVGGNWTLNGTFTAASARGLTATVSGNTVTLYATAGSSGNLLVTATDTTGHNGAISGTATTIATGPANTAFRGFAFVPETGAPSAPIVNATTPANGATGVNIAAPITVTFNQAVNVTGSWFAITGASSGAHAATVTGGPTTFTLTPTTPFEGGEQVTFTVFAAQVTDQASGTLHPAADYTATFTTVSALPLAIHTVQGSGLTSPYATQTVTVQGVVVASFQGAGKIGGYYIQAPEAAYDGDTATSEGIYVFDNANSVTVGDFVTITGLVTEFGTAPNTETEISPVNAFTKNSTGNPLPASVTVTLPFPATGYAERYEGMRVTLPQTLTVTDNFDLGHFGEVFLSNGRLPIPTNIVAPGAPAQALAAANRLNQVMLDDGVSTTYPDPTPFLTSADPATATRRAGSTTAGVAGMFANKFGAYVIEPTATPVFVDANPRPPAPTSGGTLRIAAGNVENLMNGNGVGGGFPTSRGPDTFAEYQRQLPKVTAGLLSLGADIIGLTEVENDRISNGAPDSYGPTSALAQLVDSLNASAPAGTTYAFVNAAAVDITTDQIHVAFVYRTETVETVGAPVMLSHPSFNNLARNPLAQTFRQKSNGEKLTVCINHFRAKAGAAAGAGNADSGDGQGTNNALRLQEAQALTAWLATFPTGDTDPDLLIIGDLNAYAKEDPIAHIVNAGYVNLTERFEGEGGYSYAFNGEFGHLDHALATPALNAQVVSTETWHANADEPVYYDYNVENKTVAQQAINVGTPYRYADHDPVVIGLALAPSGPPTQTYAAWAAARGLAPGQDGFTSDPEADAIVNLLEYFLGLDPLISNPTGLPTGQLEGGDFAFRFNRANTVTGVTYRVLVSSDLVNWAPVSPAPVIESSQATVDTFVAKFPFTAPRLFARLEVTSGATTVATVPIGYMNFTVAGGAPASPVTTPFGIPLDDLSAPSAGIRAGRIESFSANTLTNSTGGWTANLANPATPWFVRLTSGPAAGKLLDVVANTATTLTVSGADLTTLGLTAGVDTFELVAGDTLFSLFGSNTLLGGTSASTADNVQVRSGVSWLAYYFDTNLGFWRRTIGPVTNANNVLIRPGSGVQVIRRAAAATLTFTGRVLALPFRMAVNNASSTVMHGGFPTDATLGTLALQTLLPGWRSLPTPTGADTLSLFNGTAWVSYFHNGSFWQPTSGAPTNSDAQPIPAGALITIQRPGVTAGTTDLVRGLPYSL